MTNGKEYVISRFVALKLLANSIAKQAETLERALETIEARERYRYSRSLEQNCSGNVLCRQRVFYCCRRTR